MWGSRLQSMDAWISSQLSKLQERGFSEIFGGDQEVKSLHNWRWQSFKETEPYHGKRHFLPEKSSLEVGHHPTRPWKHLKGCLLILKSLNSDNLRRRLQESIEALGSFKELWKFFRAHALEGEQSRRSSSEHMLVKESSQDEWLLRGSWPI